MSRDTFWVSSRMEVPKPFLQQVSLFDHSYGQTLFSYISIFLGRACDWCLPAFHCASPRVSFCLLYTSPYTVEDRNYILFWLSLLWTEQVQLPRLQSPKCLPPVLLCLSVSFLGNTQEKIQLHLLSRNLRGILIFHNILAMFLITQPSTDCPHLPRGLTAHLLQLSVSQHLMSYSVKQQRQCPASTWAVLAQRQDLPSVFVELRDVSVRLISSAY